MEVAGVEPADAGASTPVSKRGAELPPEALTHILTNISGKTCLNGSRVVATDQSSESTGTSVTVGDGQELSCSDEGMKMVEVAGVEPASREFFKTASTRVVVFMVLSPVQEATPSGPRLPSTV